MLSFIKLKLFSTWCLINDYKLEKPIGANMKLQDYWTALCVGVNKQLSPVI